MPAFSRSFLYESSPPSLEDTTMYEIVCKVMDHERVMETVDSIYAATSHVQHYRMIGFQAWYRPVLQKAA